jgi:hypothetical protein
MRFRLLACLILPGVIACGGDTDDLNGIPGNVLATPGATGGTVSSPGGTTAGGTLSGTSVPSVGGTATPGGVQPGSTAGTSATGTTGGGAAPSAGNGLPCDVDKILKEKCQTCHGEPLMSGPMPLITWADLQKDSTAKPGSKIAARVKARIADSKAPMPPTGRSPLTPAEKQILDAYIDGGAKQTACTTSTPAATGGTGGTGGARLGEWTPPDSDCEFMQELRAHGGQGSNDTTPFEAPNGTDHYEIFYFTPKWNEKVHTIRIDPIIDNGAVLHHWLLYMVENGEHADGTHQSDLGLQSPDSQLLSGWAPGNKSIPLGREIGLQTIKGPNARFGIELHYNTTSNPTNRKDRSGARICATSKLRAHEASVHWLGTQLIASLGLGGMVEASGTCTVQKESHIIAHSPHMHTMGRYMKTILNRGSQKIKITDQPFEFMDQQIFPVDDPTGEIIAKPGDVIDTVCTFNGEGIFTFGPNTDQEMCYNFVVAWPAGSLSNGSPGVVGGQNTCIDLL